MGRPRKPVAPLPPPEEDYANLRTTFYHLCGEPVFAQYVPDHGGGHFAFFQQEKEGLPMERCPKCRGRVSRSAVRLPGEQFLYEMAQESLALSMEQSRDETDAPPHQPPQP